MQVTSLEVVLVGVVEFESGEVHEMDTEPVRVLIVDVRSKVCYVKLYKY